METRTIFAAVIHEICTYSTSRTRSSNSDCAPALIVEASPFLAAHIASAGAESRVESFSKGDRTFVVFRAPEETVSRYTPGDIINVKAAWTPEGLRLCL